MNKKNIIFATIVLLSVIFVFTKCKNNKSKIVYGYITPIELPVIVPGFHFPEQEDIILS